ncbi:serine/arginine repetitive matrix protein 1 isoform X2 [Dendroctonus ponderosae]|uniref:serine/arginine repetitive matrix protein 1 isoform X2 n=3 Tax=Dendroctonus ponderosae TaxID=77166 RepID=UPI00203504C8|nr:serine/arginine repetitive matrix protein 1 isoform X2 [Dendroctonus ponderosae]XP_048524163.1 serine/arginine repetitive matrix protein 1 isoform X2 [Dendroctonus ponderosae]XP_048524164.1 serine/arginine repetitive matrix protein 1 isoform X2 [Dendroctonus ponderosae]XP_048524165.1 serine/arginine repetitive matrix protein 1 isoform X2 [Dendroctonus ponderosae]XP_048524166.1 serine/arginine repetitive matrix protein 1 isoform X2 [Dendroctonus ponderosae]XP_048524167.1 serine/arginine repe
MSSRRRSRSRERKNLSSKLRMDKNALPTRITDPSLPAGRRREIDNVMKKARAHNSPNSSAIWEKKLLEVEAKDSNRWRHSGYKSLYLDGGSSSRSRSRSRSFSSTRRGIGASSPSPRRARSPRARSPRSPPPRARSPRSPPPRGRSPRSPPARRTTSPIAYRGGRPRTPPSPRKNSKCVRRSASASSVSSCSDDSCSVCSPKHRRRSRSRSFSPSRRPSASSAVQKPPPPKPTTSRRRPPSPSPPPPRRMPRPMTPPVAKRMPRPTSNDRPTDPRTRPPPPRPMPLKAAPKSGEKAPTKQPMLTRIKKEGAPRKKRNGSPGAESSGSEDSGLSTSVPIVATTAMTLSERFGKIAQWSADRERRDIENMRITKTGSNMKVMVEEDEFLYGTPPRRYSISPVPQGHYPDELLSAGQSRLAAWDDVRVRYQYYKDLGYLRDLSLDDYVKWEEWWYKYQEPLTTTLEAGGERSGYPQASD